MRRSSSSSSRAVGRRVRLEADREGVGAQHAETAHRIVPADEHRLAAAAGQRALGDPDDAQRQDGTVDPGDLDGLVQGEAQPRGQRLGDDRGATLVQRGQRRVAVARDELESPVRGEVGAGHGRAIGPVGTDGDVERRDLRHPGHAR